MRCYVIHCWSSRYPLPEKPRQKRAVIQDMVRPLKKWLLRHRHNPYPTKAEKVQLALGSNMTLVQVSKTFTKFLMLFAWKWICDFLLYTIEL